MKSIFYISLFCFCSLLVNAQKKNNSGTKTSSNPGEINSQKELTNTLLQKFASSEKVEFSSLKDAYLKPDEVTSLKLNKQGLTEIPDLSPFKNLIELDLSDNELSDFSGKLNGLSNLQSLNLSGNKLTVIPTDICGMKNLISLNLSTNKIAGGSLSCLTNLERVFLNSNELTTVPAGLTEISSLKGIYLQSNNITSVPEGLAKLPNLEILFLQFNKIATEPEAFKHTGILHYMFYPQSINSRYLYKYVYANGTYSVVATESNGGSAGQSELFNQTFNEGSQAQKKKWYVALRPSSGIGTHKAIRKLDADFQMFPGIFLGGEIEYCNAKGGFSAYFSYTEVDFNYYRDGRTWSSIPVIYKAGLAYRYFFSDINSKVRPYAKLGLGLNLFEDNYSGSRQNNQAISHEFYYRPLNLQARAGVDLYLFRFLGFNIETGFGAANRVSAGFIYRFIKKSHYQRG